MSLKSKGESVKGKPVMSKLLELRLLLEKIRPLDGKLKYQIDRLIKYSTLDSANANTENLRPDPDALLDDYDNEDNEDNDNEGNNDDYGKKISKTSYNDSDVYRAPKLVAMPYKEKESNKDKIEKQIMKKRSKLKNSEILETLREEFGVTPESFSSSGVTGMNDSASILRKEAEERRRYEEDRFVRTVMSRKDKQRIRQSMRESTRFDNFTRIGDIGDFEELAELAKDNNDNSFSNKFDVNDDRKQVIDLNASLKKAASSLSNPKSLKRNRESIDNDFDKPIKKKNEKTKHSEKDLLRDFANTFKMDKKKKQKLKK